MSISVSQEEKRLQIVNEHLDSLKAFKEEEDKIMKAQDERANTMIMQGYHLFEEVVKDLTNTYGGILQKSAEKNVEIFNTSSNELQSLIEEKCKNKEEVVNAKDKIMNTLQELDALAKKIVDQRVKQLENLIWQQFNTSSDLKEMVCQLNDLVIDFAEQQDKIRTAFQDKKEEMTNLLAIYENEKSTDKTRTATIASLKVKMAECGKEIEKKISEGKKLYAYTWKNNKEKILQKINPGGDSTTLSEEERMNIDQISTIIGMIDSVLSGEDVVV